MTPRIALYLLLATALSACGTDYGAVRILGSDVNRAQVGMSKQEIRQLLDEPSEVFEHKTADQVSAMLGKHFDNVRQLPAGSYEVWYYEASSDMHHYYVVFHYDTREISRCYFVFNTAGIAVYKRCSK